MEGAAQTLLSRRPALLSVAGQVLELRDELEAINALLIMQSEAEDGAVDRFLQVCMRQLREVAYNAEDCIDLYTLRVESRRPNDGVRACLGRLLGTLLSRRRLAGQIGALRARAVAISERQARFGVNRDALRRCSPPLLPAAPMPVSVSAPANDAADRRHRRLVSIAEQAHKLAARLKAPVGDEGERKGCFFHRRVRRTWQDDAVHRGVPAAGSGVPVAGDGVGVSGLPADQGPQAVAHQPSSAGRQARNS
ncbi:unnamed protein product [Miscanthus lutarioriparius]|uniref:Disease resistance N-terminal domain-containing protein n=1 Tax=Miscanthus lutarioriparius TaxID=422564 RepID=A0A811RFF4_9POAL|nr:unnamed protein product [Miscanthus lutarioriparius]